MNVENREISPSEDVSPYEPYRYLDVESGLEEQMFIESALQLQVIVHGWSRTESPDEWDWEERDGGDIRDRLKAGESEWCSHQVFDSIDYSGPVSAVHNDDNLGRRRHVDREGCVVAVEAEKHGEPATYFLAAARRVAELHGAGKALELFDIERKDLRAAGHGLEQQSTLKTEGSC